MLVHFQLSKKLSTNSYTNSYDLLRFTINWMSHRQSSLILLSNTIYSLLNIDIQFLTPWNLPPLALTSHCPHLPPRWTKRGICDDSYVVFSTKFVEDKRLRVHIIQIQESREKERKCIQVGEENGEWWRNISGKMPNRVEKQTFLIFHSGPKIAGQLVMAQDGNVVANSGMKIHSVYGTMYKIATLR